MPHFKSIIFYQHSPKTKLFSKKNANFSGAGGSAPRPRACGGWGLCPQTSISLWQLGAQTPKPAPSISNFWLHTCSVFPISAKKCEKCEIFSGIFALKFCEFRRFFSRQKPAFLFSAKNLRQPRVTAPRSGMSQKSRRKVAELRPRTFFFFFLENNVKSEKKMPPSA